jgi:hypothetical protein
MVYVTGAVRGVLFMGTWIFHGFPVEKVLISKF